MAFLEIAYDFSREKLFPFQGYWQYPNICPGIGQSQDLELLFLVSNKAALQKVSLCAMQQPVLPVNGIIYYRSNSLLSSFPSQI